MNSAVEEGKILRHGQSQYLFKNFSLPHGVNKGHTSTASYSPPP